MDSCSHDTVDAPIVLDDDDGSDTELDATSSSPDEPDDDDKHGEQDRDRTITSGPTELRRDRFSAGRLTNMEHDNGGSSS